MSKQRAWEVTVRNEFDGQEEFRVPFLPGPIWYDIVWFDRGMKGPEVIRSLVDHDGYPSNITVRRWR